jgi:hypothetical protein
VVRVFQGNISAPGPAAAPDFDQIYTQKIFTISRYRQHVIDDFFTVQACLKANHGDVHLDDFQIKRVRYLLDPSSLPQRISSARPNRPAAAGADPDHGTQPIANQASLPASVNDAAVPHDPQPLSVRRLDSLIDAMASRNSPPKLIECAGGRTALFRPDYDWSEQSRVRTAMLAVLETQADAMWWRLLEHARDDRYVLTAAWKGAAENVSVGSFCRDFAIADLSAPYQRHLPTVPGRLPADFRPEDVFWRNEKEYARSGKPLYQIQIELCQRAIEQWAAVKGTVAGAEGRSHTYTADEKARFLAAVKGEIVELKRRKKAVFIDATLPGVAAPSGWEGFDAESEWSARAKCDTSGR